MSLVHIVGIAIQGQRIATLVAVSMAVWAASALPHVTTVNRQLSCRLRRYQNVVVGWE